MPTFALKHSIVQAEQWNPQAKYAPESPCFKVRWNQGLARHVLETNEDVTALHNGDWIIRHHNGRYEALSNDHFQELYRPAFTKRPPFVEGVEDPEKHLKPQEGP